MTQQANNTAELLKLQQQAVSSDIGQRQPFSSRGKLMTSSQADQRTASATTVSNKSTSATRKGNLGQKQVQGSHPITRVATGSSTYANHSSTGVMPKQLMQNAKISQSSKPRGANTFSPMKTVGPNNTYNMASNLSMNPNSNSKLDVNIFSNNYIDAMPNQPMAQSHRGLLTNRPEDVLNLQNQLPNLPQQHLSQIVSSVEGSSQLTNSSI